MDFPQTVTGEAKYPKRVRVRSRIHQIAFEDRVARAPRPKNPLIRKCIKRLAENGLFGHPHVKSHIC